LENERERDEKGLVQVSSGVGAATAAVLITSTSPAFAAGAGITYEGSARITERPDNPLCIETNGNSAMIMLENVGAVIVGITSRYTVCT
jgi:hypothetical protein